MNLSEEIVTYGNPTCQKKSVLNPVSRRYIFGKTIAFFRVTFYFEKYGKAFSKIVPSVQILSFKYFQKTENN